MGKNRIAIFLLLACFCASAQEHRQLDSLKYIFPEFIQGNVVFSDHHFNQGLLNISPFDQQVYCLSGKDTLVVAGNADIVSVGAQGRYFVKWDGSFVEEIVTEDGAGVGMIRSVAKVNNVQNGAFGMKSSASSIRTYSVDVYSGSMKNIIIDDPRNYSYRVSPCLFKESKFYPVSKKSFQKLFPDLKALIETEWSERRININDKDEVVEFFYFLTASVSPGV